MNEKQRAELSSFVRITQLERCPIQGEFDRPHLQRIHQFIFQDAPSSLPGQLRPATPSWIKLRALESENLSYSVPYYSQADLAQQLDHQFELLRRANYLQDLPLDQFAETLAGFYTEFDHLHPFADGNSRTLRTFTRQLALQAGWLLDWGTGADEAMSRDLLYRARDRAVLQRVWPGLCRARADALPDTLASRAEYEAYHLALKWVEHSTPLAILIRHGLSPATKPVLRLIK
jgi:cell filamentation protein